MFAPQLKIHSWCVVEVPTLGQQQYFNFWNFSVGPILGQCQLANNDRRVAITHCWPNDSLCGTLLVINFFAYHNPISLFYAQRYLVKIFTKLSIFIKLTIWPTLAQEVTKTRNGKRNGMKNGMKRKICNAIWILAKHMYTLSLYE